MGVTVIVGPDGQARRERLIQEISCGGGSALITRTPGLAHDVARTLAVLRKNGALTRGGALPVYAWRRFVEDLWLSFGDGRTIIDDAIRAGIISRVLDLRPSIADGRPQDLLDFPGGRNLLADLLLTINNLELSSALSRSGAHEALLLAASLCLEAERADGYVEFPESLHVLTESADAAFSVVGLTGFGSLSDDELGLLLRLSSGGGEVVLELPAGDDVGALGPAQRAVDRLREAGASVIEVPGDSGKIGWQVAEAGFRDDEVSLSLRLVEDGTVTLSVGDDLQAEAVMVADRVESELSAGVNPDQIAVILRDNKQILKPLVSEFERRSLPYAVSVSVPLEATGLGSAFVQLVRIAIALADETRVGRGALASTVHVVGAFLASAYSGMRSADAGRIDAKARAFSRHPRSVIADIARDRTGRPGFGPQSPIGRIAPQARKGERGEEREWSGLEWKLLADSLLQCAHASTRDSWWASRQDECAHAAIANTLASILELGLPLDPEGLLEQCLDTKVPVGPSPHSHGRVIVGSAGAVAGRTFTSVVMCGLADSSDSNGGPTGVERILAQAGAMPSTNSLERRVLEDYTVLAGATSRVHLVWRESDRRDDGTERAALLDGVIASLGGNPVELERLLREPAEDATLGDDREQRIVAGLGTIGLAPDVATATAALAVRIKRARTTDPEVLAARCAASPLRTTQYASPAQYAPVLRTRGSSPIDFPPGYWEGRSLSPSALENYVRCPYRWFLDSVLRTYALDEDFDSAALGSAVHRVLEIFYVRWVRQLHHEELNAENLAAARQLFDEVVAGVVAELSDPASEVVIPEPSKRIEAEVELEKAWSIVKRDATGGLYPLKAKPFRPANFEWRFGRGERADDSLAELRGPDVHTEPVTVEGVPFTGSIDRIDIYRDPETGEEYLSVLDYKSKNRGAVNGTPMLQRGKIQVPLYLLIAEKALGIPPAIGGYAFYGSADNMRHFASAERSGVTNKSIKGDAFGEALDQVRALIADSAKLMRTGAIAPVIGEPRADYASCEYCSHRWCPEHVARVRKR